MRLSAQNAVTGRTLRHAARATRPLALAVMALFLVNVFCMSVGEAVILPSGESVLMGTEPAAYLVSDGHRDESAAVCRICHARTHLTAVVAWPAYCGAKLDAGSWPMLGWQLPVGGRGGFLLRPP